MNERVINGNTPDWLHFKDEYAEACRSLTPEALEEIRKLADATYPFRKVIAWGIVSRFANHKLKRKVKKIAREEAFKEQLEP